MEWWETTPQALRARAEAVIEAGLIGWGGTSTTHRMVEQMHWDEAMSLYAAADRLESAVRDLVREQGRGEIGLISRFPRL